MLAMSSLSHSSLEDMPVVGANLPEAGAGLLAECPTLLPVPSATISDRKTWRKSTTSVVALKVVTTQCCFE